MSATFSCVQPVGGMNPSIVTDPNPFSECEPRSPFGPILFVRAQAIHIITMFAGIFAEALAEAGEGHDAASEAEGHGDGSEEHDAASGAEAPGPERQDGARRARMMKRQKKLADMRRGLERVVSMACPSRARAVSAAMGFRACANTSVGEFRVEATALDSEFTAFREQGKQISRLLNRALWSHVNGVREGLRTSLAKAKFMILTEVSDDASMWMCMPRDSAGSDAAIDAARAAAPPAAAKKKKRKEVGARKTRHCPCLNMTQQCFVWYGQQPAMDHVSAVFAVHSPALMLPQANHGKILDRKRGWSVFLVVGQGECGVMKLLPVATVRMLGRLWLP